MKKRIMMVLIMLLPFLASGQSIVGNWSTIDDNTGKVRSVVQIYQKDNQYYGKVVKMSPGEDINAVCDECDEDDDRYMKKVMNMEILRGLKKDGEEYTGGKILDPENGTVYKCKVWLEKGDLMLRGYLAFFYRTQRWKKYTGDI